MVNSRPLDQAHTAVVSPAGTPPRRFSSVPHRYRRRRLPLTCSTPAWQTDSAHLWPRPRSPAGSRLVGPVIPGHQRLLRGRTARNVPDGTCCCPGPCHVRLNFVPCQVNISGWSAHAAPESHPGSSAGHIGRTGRARPSGNSPWLINTAPASGRSPGITAQVLLLISAFTLSDC